MAKDQQLKRKVYDKTDGYCHICHKKLSLHNYNKPGTKGAWHIEHSVAKANGGTDHLNNLFPAHIACNLNKATLTSRTARGHHGNTRAPYSKAKKEEIKNDNTVAGMILGGMFGLIGGPAGVVFGAAIGGAIGNSNSPTR